MSYGYRLTTEDTVLPLKAPLEWVQITGDELGVVNSRRDDQKNYKRLHRGFKPKFLVIPRCVHSETFRSNFH